VTVFGLLLLSYLLGAFPTSYVAGRITRGIDLREHGSGNLGATNAFRVLGWRVAVVVFLVDIAKGFVPAHFFPQFDGGASPDLALAYGAAAIIGHIYSVFVGFRGGKGVATGAGVFLAVAPLATLAGLAVWIAVVAATRTVSLGSILAALVVPIVVAATAGASAVLWFSLGVSAFVIFAHRSNIRRLLRGEEHRFGKRPEHAG